ncbi:MAG: hypothetical protein RLZZ04_233 [Cyanobacteriota bacterium]|jgi:hypothetical protein
MKLRFLGQAYSQSQKHILTIASEDTACYRGHKYHLRKLVAINQPQTPDSQMSAVIYKYRGVNYVVERHHFPTKPKKTRIHC